MLPYVHSLLDNCTVRFLREWSARPGFVFHAFSPNPHIASCTGERRSIALLHMVNGLRFSVWIGNSTIGLPRCGFTSRQTNLKNWFDILTMKCSLTLGSFTILIYLMGCLTFSWDIYKNIKGNHENIQGEVGEPPCIFLWIHWSFLYFPMNILDHPVNLINTYVVWIDFLISNLGLLT